MSGLGRDGAPGDPVEEYLDQLRAGLRDRPQEAEVILAEAEDHLRETVAAGVAIGMTEREAQEAAISSFGSVQAVTHAHLARLTRRPGLVDVVMAAWKLVSLLLLAGGAAVMASIILAPPRRLGPLASYQIARTYGLGRDALSATFSMLPQHLVFNWTGGTWTEAGTWTRPGSSQPGQWSIVWTGPSAFAWHTAALVVAGGAVLLAGYRLARRGRRRRGAPIAGFFPMAAVGVFSVTTLVMLGISLSGMTLDYDPRAVIAAFGVLTAGYGLRIVWLLRLSGARSGR